MGSVKYTTLRRAASADFTEKKSLFIGHAAPVRTVEEADAFILEKKSEFSDATHNVSAFIIRSGAMARYSDDGEPQGTAGIPVLDVIKKSGVDDAVVVVTRYFGGILLGAGGLVRAYSEAARIALSAAEIVTYDSFTEITLGLSYQDHGKIRYELTKYPVITDGSQFGSGVELRIAVRSDAVDSVVSMIREITSGRAVIEICGTRFDAL